MKYPALFLCLSILYAVTMRTALAQTPLPTNTSETGCISQPTPKPEGWTFDGTIFTFRPGDGLHGFRADYPSRYYVAFSSNGEAAYGSFSPDGRYFAVDQFEPHYFETWGQTYPSLKDLVIYSTSPQHEVIRYPLDNRLDTAGHNPNANFQYVQRWTAIDRVRYNLDGQGYTQGGGYVYDLMTGEAYSVTGRQSRISSEYHDRFFSYDDRYELLAEETSERPLRIIDHERNRTLNTCIQAYYLDKAWSPTADQLAFGLDETGFVYILDVNAWAVYQLDLQANDVVGWYPSY